MEIFSISQRDVKLWNLGVSYIIIIQRFYYIMKFPDDDNFEPTAPALLPPSANKWEGEDEEDDVKVIFI